MEGFWILQLLFGILRASQEWQCWSFVNVGGRKEQQFYKSKERSLIEKPQNGDGAGRKMIKKNWEEGKDENGPELLVHVWSASVLSVLIIWKEEKPLGGKKSFQDEIRVIGMLNGLVVRKVSLWHWRFFMCGF